ncbi:M1 family peptidase [Candidatus Saccharibacteria bacterium]|nr:M1 family peptidase [Candidatus Saccharibacteria bacterium]
MKTVPRLIKQFIPEHYSLSLNIEREQRQFRGTVTIEGEMQPAAQSITLHSNKLSIETVHIDGKTAEYSQGEFDLLELTHAELRPGKHVITIGYSGVITDSMHGMYPCYFTQNGTKKELVATQFESHHAREVFPCVDEPEARAAFDVTLTTEPDVTVLGNMPIVRQQLEHDKLVTTFDTTPSMSTYLLAWVYGELQKKTAQTKSGVEVNVWSTTAHRPEALDFALDHAVKTIDFFDDYFGTAYPLPKSDHVALPDFSSGAMENWGLITYRESALLADPAETTIASKQYIATVISHELSHQWFGNLVTMKWWNDLWLNESFATLMEYVAVDAIHPEWNAWLDFASHESLFALRRDAIDGVQPVQVEVNHPDEISSLFDPAIVYAKGARLMRMVQAYIGHEAFQKGLQSYFAEFAYSNTEGDDLWRHLSDASGEDISSLMNTWISQSGYPVVSVKPDGLRQAQFFIGDHEPSEKLWPIPLLPTNTKDIPELLETRTATASIAEKERLNVGDSAHFVTQYTPEHLERLLARKDSLDELSRLQLLHEQVLLARGGRVSSSVLITLLNTYADETSQHVWEIMAVSLGELKKFVETDKAAEAKLREFAGRLARPLYEKLGWEKIENEPESDTNLRATILGTMIYSQEPDVIARVDEIYASGVEHIDAELRPLVLSSVIYRTTDRRLVPELLELHGTTSSPDLRDDLRSGLTSARHREDIAYIIGKLTSTDIIRPQDNIHWFAYLMYNRHARTEAWQWIRDSWDWVNEQFGSDKSYDYYPRYAASGLMTAQQRDEYDTFFTPLRELPALTRVIDLGLKEIDARLSLLAKDGEEVRNRLKTM